jgi:hypothetical protein
LAVECWAHTPIPDVERSLLVDLGDEGVVVDRLDVEGDARFPDQFLDDDGSIGADGPVSGRDKLEFEAIREPRFRQECLGGTL